MRRFACLILIGMSLSVMADDVSAPKTLEQALEMAKSKRAYVVAAFYDKDCKGCQRFDQETFTDDRVVDWIDKRAVLIRLNLSDDSGKAAAERYDIKTAPTIQVMSSDGRVLGRQPEFIPALRFLLRLESAINSNNIRPQKGVLDAWAGQDVVLAAVDRAKALSKAGKFKEAHTEINWVTDHSVGKSPLFQLKHLADLLSVYGTIAKQYAPAMDELKLRLLTAERAVIRSPYSKAYEMYFVRDGYRAIDQPEKILSVYDKVKRITPEGVNVVAFRQLIYEELLGAHRYEELEYTVVDGADVDLFLDEARKTQRDPAGVRRTLSARYEVLLGLARFDDAKVVADKLLTYADSPATYVSLAKAAYQSGRSTHHDVNRTQLAYETTQGQNVDVAVALAYLLASRSSSPDKAIKVINDTKSKIESETAIAKLDKCLADIKSGDIRMAAMTKPKPLEPKIPLKKRKY